MAQILIVVRVILAAVRSPEHECTVAKSGEQAIEAAQSAEKIDLLIVDHSLPPGRGRDVADHILQWHPLMKVLHISGYPRAFWKGDDDIPPNAGFLGKPFTVVGQSNRRAARNGSTIRPLHSETPSTAVWAYVAQ